MTGRALPLVLVVDDEPQIQRFLRPALVAAGFTVAQAGTVADGVRRARAETPDVVVLDLGLPDGDGKDVIAALRQSGGPPILVLSARDREDEKIAALDLGADDFVNKPFGIGELLARIRVLLRSRGQAASPVLRAGPLVVDVPAHTVTLNGEALHLTPKEFDLLVLLMRHAGKVVTHRHLLGAVWGPAHVDDTQYLRVFIGQLRQKIEDDPAAPRLVLTEPGVGYRFGV